MDFSEFRKQISTPSLRAVAEHWHEARGSKSMPSWEDLRPKAIAAQLPIVWSYKYDPATGLFTGRLAGDRITQIYGKSFRGLALAEAQAPEAFAAVHALFSRVVQEPAIYLCAGRIFRQRDQFGSGERLMLPLSSDGVVSDGILGATESRNLLPDPHVPVEPIHVHEMEVWFSLRAAESIA
jgi:hypothetical protein